MLQYMSSQMIQKFATYSPILSLSGLQIVANLSSTVHILQSHKNFFSHEQSLAN